MRELRDARRAMTHRFRKTPRGADRVWALADLRRSQRTALNLTELGTTQCGCGRRWRCLLCGVVLRRTRWELYWTPLPEIVARASHRRRELPEGISVEALRNVYSDIYSRGA